MDSWKDEMRGLVYIWRGMGRRGLVEGTVHIVLVGLYKYCARMREKLALERL